MTNYTNDGTCHETSGFLFSHRCDRIAVKECVRCAKPVCQDHGHSVVDGTVCTTCLKNQVQTQTPDNPQDVNSATPGTAKPGTAARPGVAMNPNAPTGPYRSRPYYDDPYFYGSHYYPGFGFHYGYYGGGHSSSSSHTHDTNQQAPAHDPQDFTEGDAESLKNEGDEHFESEMGES